MRHAAVSLLRHYAAMAFDMFTPLRYRWRFEFTREYLIIFRHDTSSRQRHAAMALLSASRADIIALYAAYDAEFSLLTPLFRAYCRLVLLMPLISLMLRDISPDAASAMFTRMTPPLCHYMLIDAAMR